MNPGVISKVKSEDAIATMSSIPRGGGASETAGDKDDEDDIEEAPEVLYLPGLLTASVGRKLSIKDATTDSKVTITSKKAKELGVSSGDVVGVVGRRRRVTYAVVSIFQKKGNSSSTSSISFNLANNLRVREGDSIKVVPLEDEEEVRAAMEEERSGDMLLLCRTAEVADNVALAPIEDSLNMLINAEGGDEIEEEELMERFVTPYFDMTNGGGMLVKEENVVMM